MGELRTRNMNQPCKRDILCGRGGLANNHAGNRIFRRLVDANREQYQKDSSTSHRKLLVKSILIALRRQGAKFVRKENGLWREISASEAFVKISQALREVQDRSPRVESERETLYMPPPMSRVVTEHFVTSDRKQSDGNQSFFELLGLTGSSQEARLPMFSMQSQSQSESTTSKLSHFELEQDSSAFQMIELNSEWDPLPMNEHQPLTLHLIQNEVTEPAEFFDKYLLDH